MYFFNYKYNFKIIYLYSLIQVKNNIKVIIKVYPKNYDNNN